MRTSLLLALLWLVAGCGADSQGAGQVLTFTAIPDDNSTELRERFEPLAAHLSKALGIEVEYLPASSYQASVEAFKTGDVQLAWFGGLTGAQARAAVPGARAIAQGKVDPSFKSYFVVNASTGIEASDEFPLALEGRSFTFGSPSSTSGRLMPEFFLRQATFKAPEAFFGAANHYSGSHDKTAMLVAAGTFEAGVLNYKTYDRLVDEGKLDPEVVRVVWVTPDYADYNWTVHPVVDADHGAGTRERIRDALVALEDPALLAAVDRSEGLIPASNEDFAAIAAVAQSLGFLR